MIAAHLRTEQLKEPIGISFERPQLSWIPKGGIQTAYEVKGFLNGKEIFHSGKVISDSCRFRTPCVFASKDRVVWSVRLYDENDLPTEWSTSFYELGLLHARDWRASWINPERAQDLNNARKPASVLKRHFHVHQTGTSRLYITSHGLYKAVLNGKPVTDSVLNPGVDDYRKCLQVQTYDVSSLLQEGDNEILVTLGDGWYRGNNGVDGLNHYYGSDLALLLQLEVDGTPVLVSDDQWEASQNGPIRQNDPELGEKYDARMEAIMDWHPVQTKPYRFDILSGMNTVSIKEHERFRGTLIHTPNGETVIDFGQNLAGYTSFSLSAKSGQKIILRHGETLDENGNFTQSNFDPGDRNKNGGIPQKIEYICKDGLNTYQPSFTIFGFRYALVETDIDLSEAEFTAIAVYSDMPVSGRFTCGNEAVNRLFENALWSMRSNFCDIPTDCPTRERAGWTGDAAAFSPTGVFLMDCYPVLRKWLMECRLAQHDNGLVENIAPVNSSGSMISRILQGSAGWSDACILVPWTLYEAYGDLSILEENYEMMTRWMGYAERRAKSTRLHNLRNPYHTSLVDKGFHFGEWLEPDVSSMDTMKKTMAFGAPETATAYYYRTADILSRIARLLNKEEDAEKYAKIAANARKAYRYEFVKDGRIHSDRQAEYVRPIAFGLLDENEIQTAADDLSRLVEKNGFHLNTGFLSTPLLCRVLSDHGHTDTAYRLLLQEDAPGWLYAVKHGATTIWETWDGIREDGTVHDSLNHYSYGAVAGWMFSGIAGINLRAGNLTVAPKPDPSLGFQKAEWQSPYGEVRSAWRYEKDRVVFDITVPKKAEILLPDGSAHTAERGEHHYEIRL